jgi:HME family heavy-metal exporter
VPEIEHIGRRTGRAELDEHAEGVHVTELEFAQAGGASKEAIYADIRQRLKDLPASDQPWPADFAPYRPHAVRRAGADRHQDVRRGSRHPARPGRPAARTAGESARLADLEIEKQVLAPQIKVRVDFDAAARYGISTAQLTRTLQTLVDGEKVTQIVEGNRRFDLVVRLPESARSLEGLKGC